MSYPRTPTTTTSAATTTPNATPNEHYDASPATPTVWATPSASTPSKPPNSPNAAPLTAIFDADPVVWPGCVYAWLCTSAAVEGLARRRALLGRRPDWGIGPSRSTGVRKGSVNESRIPDLSPTARSRADGRSGPTPTQPRSPVCRGHVKTCLLYTSDAA